MTKTSQSNTLAIGFAMFSMFFGAGNVVFPLALGQYAKDHNFFAILGLLLTAVGVPFTGLIAMTLYNGDYKKFFSRIGPVAGFVVATIIMGLIGPFGALPRCIALSFSTIKLYFPFLSLPWFSFFATLLIFAFTIRKNNIVTILGYILTPLLLLSLGVIIIKGILTSPSAPLTTHSKLAIFWSGVTEGYQTMDLLGAFFFSSVIVSCLRQETNPSEEKNYRKIVIKTLKASAIGAFLLSLIYVGFSFVAAFESESLVGIAKEELASRVAIHVLGPHLGLIVCLAVSLACLTTAIALAAVFAEFIHKDLSFKRINYKASLVITLVISYFVSILDFTGIIHFLFPILQILYPALIVLAILNLLHKLYHVKTVKVPVLVVFVLTLIGYFWV